MLKEGFVAGMEAFGGVFGVAGTNSGGLWRGIGTFGAIREDLEAIREAFGACKETIVRGWRPLARFEGA